MSMAQSPDPINGWNETVAKLPGMHILQTWQWGQLKAMYGWRPIPKIWRNAGGEVIAAAMVLERVVRVTPFGPSLKVLYVPRGPICNWEDMALRNMILDGLQELVKQENAIFIKIDPEVTHGLGIPGTADESQIAVGEAVESDLRRRGWVLSTDQIQFRNTVWLDLSGTEEDWLARMKPKTRYNLRLAGRKGVIIRQGTLSDLPELYKMYAETSVRDGFVIRAQEYYRRAWKYFMDAGMAEVLVAEVDGQPIAGLVLFFTGSRAWYLYGMSRAAHREMMPNYLLQWEAMRRAKAHGCDQYDLWGAPDTFSAEDSMWGVFRFKEGLGGQVVRFIGAWDYPARPVIYRYYTQVIPRILAGMRRRGKEKVRREVSV